MDFEHRFEAYCGKQKLLQKGDKVLLAVSGGVDSVVLLDLFCRIRDRWNLTLSVAHLNHQLRGREADRDEGFVRKTCEQKDLPFYSEKRDVKAYSKKHRLSLEEAAREVRFEFLTSVLTEIEYDKLAMGHHANDQAETILMNMARGSGLRGLRGMRPVRGAVIRPLLFALKAQILSHAKQYGLDYVTDATNRDRSFLRNRLRRDVMPRLEQAVGSHAVASFCRAAAACDEAEEFLEHSAKQAKQQIVILQTRDEIILDIHEFFRYFKAVQKAVLIQILEEAFPRINISAAGIDRLIRLAGEGRSGGIAELDGDVKGVRSGDRLVLLKSRKPLAETTVQVGREAHLPEIGMNMRFTVFERKEDEMRFTTDGKTEYLDYDTVPNPLRVRSFRKGDVFIPLGMERKKKVHDFFIDEKIPNYRRPAIPILVGGDRIVWIVGHRIDDRCKITDGTKNILKVEIVPHTGMIHD